MPSILSHSYYVDLYVEYVRSGTTDPDRVSLGQGSARSLTDSRDHPYPGDPLRDMRFHLAFEGAIRETRHAATTGHAFRGSEFAPLQEDK